VARSSALRSSAALLAVIGAGGAAGTAAHYGMAFAILLPAGTYSMATFP